MTEVDMSIANAELSTRLRILYYNISMLVIQYGWCTKYQSEMDCCLNHVQLTHYASHFKDRL